MLLPVCGLLLELHISVPVLLLPAHLPHPKGGEVKHVDAGLPIQLLYLGVQPQHVLVVVKEVRGAGAPVWEPAQPFRHKNL